MKNIINILLFFGILFTSASINAQTEIAKEQWTFIQKRTADWCPYCGTWGWQFKTKLLDAHKDDNVIIWSAHHSGGLANATAKALSTNYGGSGQPIFFLNGEDLGLSSSSVDTKLATVKNSVETAKSANPSIVCDLTAQYENGKINVSARTQALEAANDEYKLGLYLVRKEMTAYQSSIGDNAVHKNLVVNHFGENVFGEVVDVSTKDKITETKTELDLSNENYMDYTVVALIWKGENGKHTFINGNRTNIELVSDLSDIYLDHTTIRVAQVNSTDVSIDITTKEAVPNAKIQVFDAGGKIVAEKTQSVASGQQNIVIPVSATTSGVYFIRLIDGQKSVSTSYYQQ